jgi:hypothetical protein
MEEPREAGRVVATVLVHSARMAIILAATLCSFWLFDLLIN